MSRNYTNKMTATSKFFTRLARELRIQADREESMSRVSNKQVDGTDFDLIKWSKKHFPEHCEAAPNSLHVELSEALAQMTFNRGQKRCYIAPRGSAKTTWLLLFYTAYVALEGLEPYILIVSDTATQARIHLDTLKDELENNHRLRDSYPDLLQYDEDSRIQAQGRTWRQERIILRNGVTIEAIGTRSKIRGRKKGRNRPSLVILDDPQNDENVESEKLRKADQRWLDKALLKVGNPRTNYILAGTVLHRECLVLNSKNNPGWQTKHYRSIQKWPSRMDLWQQWELIYTKVEDSLRFAKAYEFFLRNKEELLKGSDVFWPHWESLYDLMVMRITEGHAAFESEKQGNPVTEGSNEFPDIYFGDWIWVEPDQWPSNEEFEYRVISVDPSKGKDAKKGDYAAITLFGRDHLGLEWIEIRMLRVPVPELVEAVFNAHVEFEPQALAWEANAFQELMAADFANIARDRGIEVNLVLIENRVNKAVRIRRHASPLSRRLYRFKKTKQTILAVDQFKDFPLGSHDDGPDSAEMARRVAIQLSNGDFDFEDGQ